MVVLRVWFFEANFFSSGLRSVMGLSMVESEAGEGCMRDFGICFVITEAESRTLCYFQLCLIRIDLFSGIFEYFIRIIGVEIS